MTTFFPRHLAAAVLLGLSLAAVAATDDTKPSVSTPVTRLQFGPTGVSDGVHGELLVGPAYGDLTKGPHGTFIRMPAGFSSHVHTHTAGYWAVVVSGVAVNGLAGAPDLQLPVGSYWYQKGGEPHVTKCVSSTECVFFLSQDGPYDYLADTAK